MRRLSFVLLFSTWISFAVSSVTVDNNKASGENGSSLILRCNVTGNDTFGGWKSPAGIIVNTSLVLKYKQNGNNLKILKLASNDTGTWTCLSKGGNSDTVAVTLLVQPTSGTPTPTKVAATSGNTTLPTIKATTSTSDNTTLLSTIKATTSSSDNMTSPTTNVRSTSGDITSPTTEVGRDSTMNMSITVQDGNTLVSWKPSKEGKAFYFISYRIVGGDWMNTSIFTQNKYEFSNLDGGKKYEFQVYILLTENPRPYTKIQSSDIAETGSNRTKKQIIIAVVVISLVLLALIIIDIFCCFCNKCGFFHSCWKLCKQGKGKYTKKDGSPQEEINLNEPNAPRPEIDDEL